MFLSPILITQLAIASVIFESLHFQTYLVPINTDIKYLWLIPYFFTVSYFVLDDLTKFITHALMHRIPLLWEIHKTHHSARVLTPITIFRTHPLEGVIFVVRSALTQGIVIALFYYIYGNNITLVTILGANLMSFWFHLLGSNLRHSHIWINYWNWLEKIFISPAQHQIHHSIKKEHHNKNFGVTFAIWDYVFGTLCTSRDNEVSKFGITENEHKYEQNIFYLYVSPFVGTYKIISKYILSILQKLNKQTLNGNNITNFTTNSDLKGDNFTTTQNNNIDECGNNQKFEFPPLNKNSKLEKNDSCKGLLSRTPEQKWSNCSNKITHCLSILPSVKKDSSSLSEIF